MRRLFLVTGLGLALAAAPAQAVNDPVAPGDNCAAAGSQAIGHPSFTNNQTPAWAANPPFSDNNPGASTGAKGSASSQATEHCRNG